MGIPGGSCCGREMGRGRGAQRDPRAGRCHTDPKRGGLWSGGSRNHCPGSDLRSGDRHTPRVPGCRMPGRLPHEPVEEGAGAVRGAGGERVRLLVLDCTFRFELGSRGSPIRYAELADLLGVEMGDRPPVEEVRKAVLTLRRRKGVVLDPDDHDTWSAGSFFTNPVLDPSAAAVFPSDVPRWTQP